MTALEAFSWRSRHSYLNTRHRCFMDSFRCSRAGEPGAESAALLLAPAPALAALLACMQPPAERNSFQPHHHQIDVSVSTAC